MDLATLTDGATDVSTWEGMLNRLGLPLLILFLFGVAAFLFARWAAPLATQLIQRLIKFFDTLDERLDRIEAETKENKAVNTEILRELRESNAKTLEVLRESLRTKGDV